jgi:hypothetical protein
MTPEEFRAVWKRSPLVQYSLSEKAREGMSRRTVDALTRCGLPQTAEPWLRFTEIDPPDAPLADEDLFPIGFLANGSVICVRKSSDEILIADSGDPEEPWPLNSSVEALYGSLVIFDTFIREVNRRNPRFGSDYRIPDGMLGELEDSLAECDPDAMNAGGFWLCELKALDDSTL